MPGGATPHQPVYTPLGATHRPPPRCLATMCVARSLARCMTTSTELRRARKLICQSCRGNDEQPREIEPPRQCAQLKGPRWGATPQLTSDLERD